MADNATDNSKPSIYEALGQTTPPPADAPAATSEYAPPKVEEVVYENVYDPEAMAAEYAAAKRGNLALLTMKRARPKGVDPKGAGWARAAGAIGDMGLAIADLVSLGKGGLVPVRKVSPTFNAEKAIAQAEATAAAAQKAYDKEAADLEAKRADVSAKYDIGFLNADAAGRRANAEGRNKANAANAGARNAAELTRYKTDVTVGENAKKREQNEKLTDKKIAAAAARQASANATRLKAARISKSGNGSQATHKVYSLPNGKSLIMPLPRSKAKNGTVVGVQPAERALARLIWRDKELGTNSKHVVMNAFGKDDDGNRTLDKATPAQIEAFIDDNAEFLSMPVKKGLGKTVGEHYANILKGYGVTYE